MLKITSYFKNQILYHASTINVAIRETGSSEPCINNGDQWVFFSI